MYFNDLLWIFMPTSIVYIYFFYCILLVFLAPFNLNTCLSSFQGIINAHQHLYVYSKRKDHLVPETSITFLAFEKILSVISLHLERSAALEKEVCLFI